MKRVAFAWKTFVYDFTTYEEAWQFMADGKGKGWFFYTEEPYHNSGDDFPWSVKVDKPLGNYCPGW